MPGHPEAWRSSGDGLEVIRRVQKSNCRRLGLIRITIVDQRERDKEDFERTLGN